MEGCNSIVAGMGEVGSALFKILKIKYKTVGIDVNTKEYPEKCRFLNICIPYSDNFINIVNNYVDKFKPELTINHSSVPVGTTKKIKGLVVHSPVRGRHPKLYEGILHYIKYVGYNDRKARQLMEEYWGDLLKVEYIKDTDTTELMKLASLAIYGAYLEIAREINNVCEYFHIDYDYVNKWFKSQNEHINRFYPDLKMPILSPPKKKIGGHCVLPITDILLRSIKDAGIDTKILQEAFLKNKGV